LKQLENKLPLNKKLTISSSDVSQYYFLNNVDCLFSGNQIMLKISIPIMYESHEEQFLQFTPLPFARNNETCSIDIPEFNFIHTHSRQQELVRFFKTECNPVMNSLCLVEEIFLPFNKNIMCVNQIIEGGPVSELSKVCPIQCSEKNSMEIIQISYNSFIVTFPPTIIYSKCLDITYKPINIKHPNIGNYEIKIPCHCEVKLNDFILSPKYPCLFEDFENGVTISHKILFEWSKTPSINLSPYRYDNYASFDNIFDVINIDEYYSHKKVEVLQDSIFDWKDFTYVVIFIVLNACVVKLIFVLRARTTIYLRNQLESLDIRIINIKNMQAKLITDHRCINDKVGVLDRDVRDIRCEEAAPSTSGAGSLFSPSTSATYVKGDECVYITMVNYYLFYT
jgi:hypothetical protein